MSKDQESTYLLFKQAILIENYKIEEEDKGMLTTKGYADERSKYQTYENILYFQNYRDAIFQIIPAGNFQIHDEILKDYPSRDNLTVKDLDNLKKLQKRAVDEAAQFQLGIDITKNSQVFFGTDVMFKHLDSQSYLCGTIDPSQGDNGAFAVKVSSQLSSDLIWKLLPYRSFEFSGMPIPFGSPIQIQNVANGSFLTFQKIGRSEPSQQRKLDQKSIPSDESFHIPIKKKSEHSKIYSCVSHSNDLSQNLQTPMPWEFKLHMNNVENQKLIQHDIVYFEHSQSKGVLTAFKNQVALKENKIESWVLSCYDCLWEIQKYSEENEYILRHLMSGMTLSFVEKENENGKRIIPMLAEIASAEQLGTVEMRVATKEIGEINSNSKVHFYKDNLVLDIVKHTPEIELSEGDFFINESKIIQSNYNAVVEGSLEYVRKDLELTEEVPTHCFIIMEIDDDTKKEVLFALSFHQTLISLIDQLKWGTVWAQKKITYKRMIMLNQSLQQIKGFIKNCDVSKAEKEEILPIQKRQTICKDLGMSELLFQLLYYMKINKKEKIFQQDHNEREKFDDLYNTCYEVIEIMVKNHTLFKVHVSRWIDFIVEDVIENQNSARLSALLQILQGNNLIIQNFITDGFIKHLFDSFNNNKENNKIKYLKFFRAFCIVNDKAITKNQTAILEGFIKKCEGTQHSFNFRVEKDVLQIEASLDKSKSHQLWREFTDYHKAVVNEDREMWNYFIEYMHLLADLCYGRNKYVKSYFEKTYDLSLLINLLQSPSVNEAYVPVLRLVLHLYIEGSAYYPITRMNRILKYENIVPEPLINSCIKQGKYWNQAISHLLQDLMSQLISFQGLNSIPQNNGTREKGEIQKNQKLKIILKAIQKTIQLGYWTQFSDLIKIAKKIQKILENDPKLIMKEITEKEKLRERYEEVKEDFTLSSRRNKILVDCQEIATKIILKIKDFESDLRMRQTCFIFKGLIFSGGMANDIHRGDPEQSLEAGVVRINQEKVKIWVEKLKQLEENQKEILDRNNITRILIQLSQYNNPKLISQSLQIMKMVYDSREENINNFCELTLVDSGEFQEWYQYITKRAEKFFALEDQNTLKVTTDTQSLGYYNINKEANDIKDSGIMQDLYMFWELMKSQNKISSMKNRSLGQSNIFQHLASDRLMNLSNERETNNKLKQKIMKSTQIHSLVLYYITSCESIPDQELASKLLHMCYIYLTGLIVNNQQSKLQIQKHVGPMKNHLQFNVGAIDFFKEMYDNNKNMLYNQNEIRELTTIICDIINTLSPQQYYRSKLLDFFRSLIFFNDKNLKFNQIHILKIMQDDEYNNVLISVSREGKDRVAELIAEFDSSNVIHEDEPLSPYIKISAELTYVYTFFQIMAVMIEGKNIVNIGKLTKRHPFEMLVEYIEISGKCWPLRRNIRAYLNKLYYINDGLECYLKTILEKELNNIIFDLNCYIQSKISSKSNDFELQSIENPVRFTYMESYLYLNLEEVLYSLYEILHHQKIKDEINIYIGTKTTKIRQTDQYSPSVSLAYSFLLITERLGYIKNFFNDHKCIYTCHLIKYIQGKLRAMITDWPDFVFEIHPSQRSMKNNQKVKMRESLINKLIAGDIGSVYARMNKEEEKSKPLCYELFDDKNETYRREPAERDLGRIEEEIRGKLVEILLRTRKNESDKNKELQEMMGTVLNTVKLSEEFQKYTKESFLEMANYFSNIDQESARIYRGEAFISKQEYIKIIITMNSTDPNALSPELKIFFLRLMTRSISEKNKKDIKGKPIDEWDTTYWDGSEKAIVKEQKKMVNCGLATFISQLLSSPDITENVDLANEILICGIAFLLGGFQQSQVSILEMLAKDQDNKVLENIQRLIKKLGDLIYKNNKKKRVISKDCNRTFETNRCDNYDHYDINKKCVIRKNVYEPDNAKQEQYKNTCITTFRRAFKFIQLLCENNNNVGKNFIREQKTKEETKKLNSINFIQLATNQLRQMFKIFCNSTMEIPIFILDFINEVTQIPVMENQMALMRSTFFEDLCQLEDTFSKEENLREREIGEEGIKALSEIYSKAVTIILSNFEGNKEDTFSMLDNQLQSKFLINILEKLLKSQGLTNLQKLKTKLKKSKGTIFQEGIQNILNIIIIFKKMEDKLPKGKLVDSYKEYKDSLKYQTREKKVNTLPNQPLENQTKLQPSPSLKSLQSQGNPSSVRLSIPTEESMVELVEAAPVQIVEEQVEELSEVIEYLQKRILKIQITTEDEQNQIVYFPKHQVFNSLSQQLRNQIMTDVKRESHREKIVSLFKLYPEIKTSMEHSFKLQKKEGITESYINNIKTVSCIISIVITVMLMINYNIVIEYQETDFFLDGFFTKSIVKLLCLAHLGTLIYYFVLWKKARGGEPEKEEDNTEGDSAEKEKAGVEKEGAVAEKEEEDPEEASSSEDKKEQRNLQPFYKDQAFAQQAIFFTFSVLGTFYQPYLFTLQLLDIFIMIDVLKDIFQAIATNIKPLAIVSVMGVAFMFIFCLIGFSNYMKNIYQNESIDEMCGTVSSCILDMYVSGVIGQKSGKFDWTRFSYDSIYFVFFGLLFGNIISGIMINSFAEKREKKEELEEDKRNNCYICNINRDAIEKTGDTFEKHTRENHFLWNYIFYKYALDKKDPTEYTGLEYYISDKICKEQVEINWIPDNQKGEFSAENSVQSLIELMKCYDQNMSKNIDELDEKVEEINKCNDDIIKNKIDKLQAKIEDIKGSRGDFISKDNVEQLEVKLQGIKKNKDLKKDEMMSKLEGLDKSIEDTKRSKEEELRNRIKTLESKIESMKRNGGPGGNALSNGEEAEEI